MFTEAARRVGSALDGRGHALTSFDEQEVDFEEAAAALIAAVMRDDRVTAETPRTGMIMLQNPTTTALAKAVVQPLVDALFDIVPGASDEWNLYGVNHYVEGDKFKPHQDYFDGVVMVITICGRRSFDVYRKEPVDDLFVAVDSTYALEAGRVVLLDGIRDLGHASQCVAGPSISIVADVSLRVADPRPTRHQDSATSGPDAPPFSPYEHPEEFAVSAGQTPADIKDLSADQQDHARAVVAAMAAELALDPDDIRFVRDGDRVVAIDASPNGQHVGSHDELVARRTADPRWYTISVGDQVIDVLEGNTDAAYRSMVVDAEMRGVPLPDSLALSQLNGVPWTATMLTGEPLTPEGRVQVLSVNDGNVNRVDFELHRGGQTLRVRPAVMVGQT